MEDKSAIKSGVNVPGGQGSDPYGYDVTPEDIRVKSLPIWYRFLVLALLFANYFVAQYDKFVLSYFHDSITLDLQLSNSEYGLLSGYATGIVYALLAIPVSYLADYASKRVWALTVCVMWWSICVIFQGLSRNFWQILLARIGMGIGQSAVEALSISLISDYMDREWVLFGDSFLYVGVYVGEAISAQIAVAFRKTNTPWYTALRAIGIVGIVIGVLLRLVLREPARQASLIESSNAFEREEDAAIEMNGKRSRAWADLKQTFFYVVRMRSFWLLSVAAGFRQLSGNIFGYYMPSYLQGLYPSDENLLSNYGIIVGVVGSFAVLAGGLFCSFYWKRSVMTPLLITAVGGMISSVFVVLMIFSRSIAGDSEANGVKVLYGTMTIAYLTAELWLGAFNSLLVFLLPPRYKTFALAMYMSIIVFMYSSGPQIVGLALQNVDPTGPGYELDTRIILAVIIPVGYWLAGIGFLFAIRFIRQDLQGGLLTKRISARRKVLFGLGAFILGGLVIGLFVSSIIER